MSSSPPKTPPPKRPSKRDDSEVVSANSLAGRIRALREKHGTTRKALADSMRWSESRLVHYESGNTEPTVSELAALADLFAEDRAWLAFGAPYGSSNGRVTIPNTASWVSVRGGGEMPVPASLLEGVLGPFQCVVLENALPGMSRGDVLVIRKWIKNRGKMPAPGQAWVMQDGGENLQIAWVVKATAKTASVRLAITDPPQVVPTHALLGQIVGTMRRSCTSS